jgi:autotransporter-associated beta strand protein
VGAGIITLAATNTYSGPTNILIGALLATTNGALGSIAGGTTVALNATLGLSGDVNYTAAEPLTVTGPGALGAGYFFTGSAVQRGVLQSVAGNNTWSGDISFSGNNTRVGVQDGAKLTIAGSMIESIPGSAMVFRHGNTDGSDVIISGAANNWTGNTDIFGGGGAVKLGRTDALPSASQLRVGTSGIPGASTFDLNGFNQTSAGLSQVVTATSFVTNNGASASTLTLNPAGTSSYSGVIQNGTNTLALTKTGSGIQTLTGISTYTGRTIVTGGTLNVAITGGITGSTALTIGGGIDPATLQADGIVGAVGSITTVGTAGTLSGAGTVNGSVQVESGGAISPGSGPGLLTINEGLTLKSGGHLAVDFFSNFPGFGYDQVAVTSGNISLAGDFAGSSLAFTPVEFSDVFFIIVNNGTGTTSGTLGGAAEGGTLKIGEQSFRISYVADAIATTSGNFGQALGNDVALLAIPEPTTAFSALLGLGLLAGTRRRFRS